jgi:hypothetical protein
MDTFSSLIFLRIYFSRRIYWLFLAVVGLWLVAETALSQELNAYKTIASGTFSDVLIWAVWDGLAWNPSVVKPGQGNDIYIDQTHILTLTGNETVKSIFINAEVNAFEKLNLNGYNLDVYGSLNAFSGAAPGAPANAWNSQNWIGNSNSSVLTFKGTSRVLVKRDSWSAQTTQSRFAVIFEADAGETFILEAPFKSLSFIIRSGTVHQKIDTSVIPNVCHTLSFNNESTVFGDGPFGELRIEPGATFLSECNSNILNRSTGGTVSAHSIDLQEGGTLILEGSAPRIEAANFQLNGKVVFRGGSSTKTYLASSYADASVPTAVRDLEIQGPQDLNLPDQLTISGNLEKTGSGNFIATNSTVTLAGAGDQEIRGFSLDVRDLILNKSDGDFFPNSNLTIHRNLTLLNGSMDLGGHDLSFNTSRLGTYAYSGGSWRDVGRLNYLGIPSILTASNATFPFEDTHNGGSRKVQLLGTTAGGDLSVTFTEYEGAEYNSDFNDSDNSEILYRLFSYFQFSNLTPSAAPLELRISAHQLIVDDVDDLRIVGTGYAAPGSHLPGIDPEELWARRQLTFTELLGTNFTIGSYRTLSVLPLIWLEISHTTTKGGVLIKWMVAHEEPHTYYEIYRTADPLTEDWEIVGITYSSDHGEDVKTYHILDELSILQEGYYQIRQLNASGKDSWSEVIKVSNLQAFSQEELLIYPNPYSSVPPSISIPADIDLNEAMLIIHDSQGRTIYDGQYGHADTALLFQDLPRGLFYLKIVSKSRIVSGKLIRK